MNEFGWIISSVVSVIVGIVVCIVLLAVKRSLEGTAQAVSDELRKGREEASAESRGLREEVGASLTAGIETLTTTLKREGELQQQKLTEFARALEQHARQNGEALEKVRSTLDERLKEIQTASDKKLESVGTSFNSASESLSNTLKAMGELQQAQLGEVAKQIKELTESTRSSLDRARQTMDDRVKELQESNEKKLDEMRKTVDEKLHETLEKRLGESFKIVSDRLEAVHKGLGEMQNLATGVGDLKRVLTNVKQRGTLGETQLGSILEEILSPQQYERNVATNPATGQRVEYAIKLPGANNNAEDRVWLPIDSKFPQEDYVRLQEASERGDAEAVQQAAADLAKTIKREASAINDKYLNPPATTDFAIMFVPTEGLYAEIVKQPALLSDLNKLRVIVSGPLTLTAILSSLRMGFQTVAISARADEVWNVLAAVKTEFGKFGEVLAKVKKQLGTATRTIEETETRTRAMSKKLKGVVELPVDEAAVALSLQAGERNDEGDANEEEEELLEQS